MKYEPLYVGIGCDLCVTTLEDAMIKICGATDDQGRAIQSPTEYELRVSKFDRVRAGRLLDDHNLVNAGRSPMRIHVELKVDPEYTQDEWSLHALGRGFGSGGS